MGLEAFTSAVGLSDRVYVQFKITRFRRGRADEYIVMVVKKFNFICVFLTRNVENTIKMITFATGRVDS